MPGIRIGQTVEPEEVAVPDVRGVVESLAVREIVDRAVDPEEDRDLDQHRQTPRHRVYPIGLVELHRLLRETRAVLAVLLLQLLDLRLQLLHRFAGADRLDRQRQEQRLDDDREGDHRQPATVQRASQEVECVLQKVDVRLPAWRRWEEGNHVWQRRLQSGQRAEKADQTADVEEISEHGRRPPPAIRGTDRRDCGKSRSARPIGRDGDSGSTLFPPETLYAVPNRPHGSGSTGSMVKDTGGQSLGPIGSPGSGRVGTSLHQGTGSYPPRQNGLQRQMRQTVKPPPLMIPYLAIAS